MSTREYQAYEDAVEALNKAQEVLEYTKRACATLTRTVASDLRERFPTELSLITTRTIIKHTDRPAHTEFYIHGIGKAAPTEEVIVALKDYLMSKCWKIKHFEYQQNLVGQYIYMEAH